VKLALVQCPAFGVDAPSLAVGYLYAFLKQYNYDLQVFDFNIELFMSTDESNKHLWEFQHVFKWIEKKYFSKQTVLPDHYFKLWAEKIIKSGCDVIGFSIQSASLEPSLKLAEAIKNKNKNLKIIFGGPLHLSYTIGHADYLLGLKNAKNVSIVDVVVIGEGEVTLREILKRFSKGDSLKACPGTIIRNRKGQVINNGLRPLIKDLDAMPFPAFEAFPSCYKDKNKARILTSRGCVNQCVFCDDRLIWPYYRSRSPENIIKEMSYRKNQGIEFIEFNDLLMNASLGRLNTLCDILIKKKINIAWGCCMGIDRRMDVRFFKKLKRAGCRYINYGIKSASKKVRQVMRKPFLPEDVARVIQHTYNEGIEVCSNWIVGFPSETYAEFQDTLDFIKKNIK